MNATLPTPAALDARRSAKVRKAVPAQRVEDLLREIVIAMHATRAVKKLPVKA